MKKIWRMAAAVAALVFAVSCSKDNQPLTPEQQKAEFESIAAELMSIGKKASSEDVAGISSYFTTTLSTYDDSVIKGKSGGVLTLVDAFFSTLPGSGTSTKSSDEVNVTTKGVDWNIFSTKASFYANPQTKSWEYRGTGNEDGINFYFNDDKNRECHIKFDVKNNLINLLSGNFNAGVEMFLNNDLLAQSTVSCLINGLTDLTAEISTSYGQVKNITTFASKSGEYGIKESLTYGGRNIANCLVSASGISFSEITDVISTFNSVTVNVDVLDRLNVVANVNGSIPDLFLTDWSKDYLTKLQEYLDKNVNVKVYYDGGNEAQAEITLKVQQTGAPLFGSVEVVPYIKFTKDEQSYELSDFIKVDSLLPNILESLKDIFGNINFKI
ncbi:MAG: hypothetical protein HUJ92_01645 [Bacteroidales bacterium]|nr:hypothetical protein [Bacteroidales bacterium]